MSEWEFPKSLHWKICLVPCEKSKDFYTEELNEALESLSGKKNQENLQKILNKFVYKDKRRGG